MQVIIIIIINKYIGEKIMRQGKLFVIAGPSGVGKNTIIQQILQQLPDLKESISATTRPMRDGEIEGQSYYFIDKEKFESLIQSDYFLEYVQYNNYYYGTPITPIQQYLNNSQDIIMILEINGALKIKKIFQNVILFFIIPPSLEELETRLRFRGTETEDKIQKRLTLAKEEIKQKYLFDYVVLNDTIDNVSNQIIQIIKNQILEI